MKNWIKNFLIIIDKHVLIVVLIAIISTVFCSLSNIHADLPTGLIGIAVIFPIVFSINAAYKRREDALKSYGSIKGHAISLYFAHRDWITDNDLSLSNDLKEILKNLDKKIWSYLCENKISNENLVYSVISEISIANQKLKMHGATSGDISRANQYQKNIACDFEKIKYIKDYRTPIALRAYSKFFLNTFPIFFAPFFAEIINTSGLLIGYTVAVLYSVVLVCLDNIQDYLENPFDQLGEDDICANLNLDFL